MRLQKILLFFFNILPFWFFGQTYTPGNIYYGTNNYIEYHSGNLPIILSAPHGGYLKPASIPNRNCSGCVTIKDNFTLELTLEVATAIHKKTNCYPHVIINNLHRIKLDANRDIIEATGGDSNSFVYWYDYNDFIDSARVIVNTNSAKGLFIDMHGHGHSIQRLEIGYLLSKTDLQSTDATLNTTYATSKSSLKSLVNSNLSMQTHAELIRGNFSLGTILSNRGFPCVPSTNAPFPFNNEPYFSGGYNTKKWGSSLGGQIDGIQIEHNSSLRADSTLRKNYADSLATTLIEYMEKHYFVNFTQSFCNYNLITKWGEVKFSLLPNPTNGLVSIIHENKLQSIVVYSLSGKKLLETRDENEIEISFLKNGMYLIELKFENTPIKIYRRIIKN